MSEALAIENDDEVLIEEEIAEIPEVVELAEGEEAVDDEVEIVIDGDEEPASKAVPKGFYKRIGKLNGKIDDANSETEQVKRQLELSQEENKLLRLQNAPPAEALKRPRQEDFDTDNEFEAAEETYLDARADKRAEAKLNERITQHQTTTTQTVKATQLREDLEAHYTRAESSKIKDYEALEDKAIEKLGNDVSKVIMANTPNSERIMAYLGKFPAQAEALKNELSTNPIKGMLKLAEIGLKVKAVSKSKIAPNPETSLEKGSASSGGSGNGVTYS